MIVLVDAKNLLFRAHFAHEGLRARYNQQDSNEGGNDGPPTGAIYGFLASIRALRKDFAKARMIMCWEGGVLGHEHKSKFAGSWRKEVFPEYKAKRASGDERYLDALKQIPTIVRLIASLGCIQVEVEGLEADDLIALLAHRTVQDVVAYSNDADLLQLLTKERIRVARPSKLKHVENGRYEFVTAKEVVAKYGVTPGEWASYRALAGDPSDNIKVLKGIGPKKAIVLLKDGLNPALRHFTDLSAKTQTKYKQFESLWPKLHIAYEISKLPERPTRLPVSLRQQALVGDLLERILTGPLELEPLHVRMKVFMNICADNDMRTFLAAVGEFFPLNG